jgi:hypothetical protein
MFKRFMVVAMLASMLFQFAPASAFTSKCMTSGKGYASKSERSVRTILDLRVSIVPGDDATLQEMLNKWIADGHVFVPKPGIEVNIVHGGVPNDIPIFIRPEGSEQTFYITKEGLENCR